MTHGAPGADGVTLRRAWRRHPVLTALFVLAILVTSGFAARTAIFVVYWSDPTHRDATIEGWMTPGYVARSWHVAPDVVAVALGVEIGEGHGLTLEALARERGVPLSQIEASLAAAIAAARAGGE